MITTSSWNTEVFQEGSKTTETRELICPYMIHFLVEAMSVAEEA